MRKNRFIEVGVALAVLCGIASSAMAQPSINLWRGNESKANWTDAYKWKLKHVPATGEAVHFRQANSVIVVNSTVGLDNSMQLYGQELSLEGNGNINLWSPIPNRNTVYIPASATGYANLTLSDNLSINGQVALAAKAYGTSASKGSVTLKDRSTIAGKLSIGNDGNGSGRVFIRDQSVFRISGLELHTLADQGGSAEIHILGGTARFESGTDPFEAFLADPSRKIVLGDYGTLCIDSDWPIWQKKKALIELIKKNRLVAAPGCKLNTPVFQKNMLLLKAETTKTPQRLETLLADIGKTEAEPEPAAETPGEETIAKTTSEPPVGYIVFLGAILLFLRPAKPATPASNP